MKCMILVTAICLFALSTTVFGQETPSSRAPRVLIAFFSHTNNTRAVAEEIHRSIGGDMFAIRPKNAYPQNHQETVNLGRQERDRNARPELAETIPVETMRQYDIIFIGFPNWWMTMPMVVRTFLEQYDFSGKMLVPFCTHGGSGLSNTEEELRQSFPGANVLQGLAVNGRMASRAQNDVANWLRTLRFIS